MKHVATIVELFFPSSWAVHACLRTLNHAVNTYDMEDITNPVLNILWKLILKGTNLVGRKGSVTRGRYFLACLPVASVCGQVFER